MEYRKARSAVEIDVFLGTLGVPWVRLDRDHLSFGTDQSCEDMRNHCLMGANVEDASTGSKSALSKIGQLRQEIVAPFEVVPPIRCRVRDHDTELVTAIGAADLPSWEGRDLPGPMPIRQSVRQGARKRHAND